MSRVPVLLSAGFAACLSLPVTAQRTVRVSRSTLGTPANANTQYPGISGDGRFVVFTSPATNLVLGDANRNRDVFLHDRFTSETTLVSVSTAGIQGDADSNSGYAPALSADGRFVVFTSGARNLVPGDTNRQYDVFVRDVKLGTTRRVSESAAGGQVDESSFYATISADGRYVAFATEADNLVLGDTNHADDVFIRDLVTGTIVRASVNSTGAEGDGDSYESTLSADGRYVAFSSEADNLVPGDTNQDYDVFVRDLLAGTTTLVSVGVGGAPGNFGSFAPSISRDGRIVAFVSLARDLVSGDLNGYEDVFTRDLGTGVTALASVSTSGQQGDAATYYQPILSGSGRFVAFNNAAYSMVVPDAQGGHDVYLHDLATGATTRESVSTAGEQGNDDSYAVSVSDDGRFVAFKSTATNLVEQDMNGAGDILVRDRGSLQAALFCGSEAVGASCPCANPGGIASGCDNSAYTRGAWLVDFGSASVSNDSLVIVASGVIAGSRSVLVQGTAQSAPRPLGEGVRCIGSSLRRLYSKTATAGGGVAVPGAGDPPVSARSASAGDPIAAGATRYYQLHYHDDAAEICGGPRDGGWNSSSGIAIAWAP